MLNSSSEQLAVMSGSCACIRMDEHLQDKTSRNLYNGWISSMRWWQIFAIEDLRLRLTFRVWDEGGTVSVER